MMVTTRSPHLAVATRTTNTEGLAIWRYLSEAPAFGTTTETWSLYLFQTGYSARPLLAVSLNALVPLGLHNPIRFVRIVP